MAAAAVIADRIFGAVHALRSAHWRADIVIADPQRLVDALIDAPRELAARLRLHRSTFTDHEINETVWVLPCSGGCVVLCFIDYSTDVSLEIIDVTDADDSILRVHRAAIITLGHRVTTYENPRLGEYEYVLLRYTLTAAFPGRKLMFVYDTAFDIARLATDDARRMFRRIAACAP